MKKNLQGLTKKIVTSSEYAIDGLRAAFTTDLSFRLDILIGIPILIVLIAGLWPLAGWEWLGLIFGFGLVIIAELLNTAIETLLEKLHPIRHHLIGASKDIAAASVFIAYILFGVVVFVILLERFPF